MKNQRIFLRRTKYDDVHSEDLFVGNRVNVFSRQLNLIDYGDQYTANKLGSKKERYDCSACVISLPDPFQLHASLLYIALQIISMTVAQNIYQYFHSYLLCIGPDHFI